jgi:hypothetical protein
MESYIHVLDHPHASASSLASPFRALDRHRPALEQALRACVASVEESRGVSGAKPYAARTSPAWNTLRGAIRNYANAARWNEIPADEVVEDMHDVFAALPPSLAPRKSLKTAAILWMLEVYCEVP